MPCHESAIDQLRQAGFRLTPQRALILDVVYHAEGHLTVEEVHERVRASLPFVDLSTVYRNLQFLRQEGLIGELRLEGQPVCYEAVRAGQEHHHAVCTTCGRMLSLETDDLAEMAHLLLIKYGFRAHLVHMLIPGTCASCAEQID
jgi:Fur family ferric uptake transcriptional regulator